MTHDLIVAYGLFNKMKVLRPRRAQPYELTRFHTDEYISFLQRATPENTKHDIYEVLNKFNLGDDSPPFAGVFEFCQISAGGSISAARILNEGKTDIAINWAGGLHHAKRSEASGFCFVADCVLGIIELLKNHDRVMYIDIDIHHGDGVEEAFYTTDRVLTVSFHKYGDEFFPRTGNISDIGIGRGRGYSVNVPLRDGMDDLSFVSMFKSVIEQLMEWYRPGAIFLQCGADSLTGDRIGCFNLTIKGHAECVNIVKSYGLPMIVSGGGGYTVRNVARCWAFETAVLIDEEIPDVLPFNDYMGYFGPDYRLHLHPSNMENLNSKESMATIYATITEHIRETPAAPNVDRTLGIGLS